MKKIKSLIAVLLCIILLFAINSLFISKVYADNKEFENLFATQSNYFEFNPDLMMSLYSDNETGENSFHWYRYELNDSESNQIEKDGYLIKNGITIIPLSAYLDGVLNSANKSYKDGMIDARDSSFLLSLSLVSKTPDTIKSQSECKTTFTKSSEDIMYSLIDGLKRKGITVNKDDITLYITNTMPAIEEHKVEKSSFTVNSKDGITNDIYEKIMNFSNTNIRVIEEIFDNNVPNDKFYKSQVISTAKAVLKDGSEYGLVLGTDNNYYLIQTKEATPEPKKSFETVLTYRAEESGKKVDGKMDKDVFLPPYYENEDKDAKKDVDAIGIITSKTDEEIVATNDVPLSDKNVKGNPNSEGWYYPDLKNKKVIEKVYKFDVYNNPKDNGAVKETVKLTGKDSGTDSETPNIKWTLRRINYEEKTNPDKSITVTITYNLPIDEKSIPEGWSPILDKDSGIRKIQRTFKEGEDYNKEVTVEQNGDSKATVTTPVVIKWDKADKIIPQTGTFTIALIAVVAGIAIFAYTRYRKLI